MVPTILMARLAVKSPDTDPISAPTFILPSCILDLESDSTPSDTQGSRNNLEGSQEKPHSPIEMQNISNQAAQENIRGSTGSVQEVQFGCNRTVELLRLD